MTSWGQAKTTATTAPRTPAAPYETLIGIAPFGVVVEDALVEVPLAAFGVAALLEVVLEEVVPPVVPAGVVAAGVVAAGVAAVVAVPFKQVTSVPATVNGAVCPIAPVESIRLRPRLVLGG